MSQINDPDWKPVRDPMDVQVSMTLAGCRQELRWLHRAAPRFITILGARIIGEEIFAREGRIGLIRTAVTACPVSLLQRSLTALSGAGSDTLRQMSLDFGEPDAELDDDQPHTLVQIHMHVLYSATYT